MNNEVTIQHVIDGYKAEVAELTHAKVVLAAQLRAAYEEIAQLRQADESEAE